MAVTFDYLNSLLARELEQFDEYARKYKIAVATNDTWGINRFEAVMETYHEKAKLIREIMKEL